jgi:hypothetical protein
MGSEFSEIIIVDALLHSCGRIHCKTLLAQEVGITLAVERIRTLTAEAPRAADLGPVLMHVKIGEFIARRPVSPFNVTTVRTDLADVAETALREAHEVVARLSVPVWPKHIHSPRQSSARHAPTPCRLLDRAAAWLLPGGLGRGQWISEGVGRD